MFYKVYIQYSSSFDFTDPLERSQEPPRVDGHLSNNHGSSVNSLWEQGVVLKAVAKKDVICSYIPLSLKFLFYSRLF